MDPVRLAAPYLLLAAPAAWAAILFFIFAAPRRRPGAPGRAILACVAAGLLALALAGPSLRVSREGPCPVWLVEDVSPSMRPSASAPAADADPLGRYAAAIPSGPAGRIRFLPDAASPGAPQTDIRQALEQAAAAAGGDCGILLLYSDGRETQGRAADAAGALAARGLRVYAALPQLAPRDVRVAAVSAPAATPLGTPVAVKVRLASTVPATAVVQLQRRPGGDPAARDAEVSVDPATGAEVLFEDTPPAPGLYAYHVQVRSSADDWPENDRASCMVRVGESFDVAYVYGGDAPPAALAWLGAKAPAGVRIRPVAAERFARPEPGDAAVVLDNVSAWSLRPETLADLARRVTDGGLGLLALGGDTAFSAGGYDESPLESLLPVSSRAGVRPPLDIVFVIDSSGSMNEAAEGLTKLALAKFAVLDLREALAPADRIGVVAFAGEPRIAAPLAPASDWDRLRRRLVEIEAGGGTRITPAVTAAIGLFGPAGPADAPGPPAADARRLRHVVLLSDGRSADFDVPALAAACRAGAASLSAVSTGPDADRQRLGRLAEETGGRLYVSGGVARRTLRETFLRDLAWKRGVGLRTETRPAAWLAAEPIWRDPGPPLPAVAAVNATQPKPAADLLWTAAPAAAGQTPAPLLAAWRKGLGKVAAMPWPVSGASGRWTEGEALGGYLAAIVGWLYQPAAPRDWSAKLVERGPAWWVRVEDRPAALGKSLPPPAATVWGEADAGPHAATLMQVAPGVYEGKVGAEGGGAAMVVVHRPAAAADSSAADSAASGGAEETVQLAAPGLPPPEYAGFGVDRPSLEAIVRAGGGSILASPDALAEVVREMRSRGYTPVGIYLVLAAGAVMLVQVALRMAGKL
jgi:Mg-chelatase subunit ChlD